MQADVIAAVTEAAAHPAIAAALAGRAELMAASQRSYQAVVAPRDPGGLNQAERLALACRIARLNGDGALAEHYRQALGDDAAAMAVLAVPDAPPPDDMRLAAMLRHVDLVTRDPKRATRDDLAALQAAGIAQADIVRLTQLIAFVNYQVRVIAGLRLIGGAR